MTNTWFIADPHFGHHGTAVDFTRDDGSKLRPFSSVEEQDDTIIGNWNRLVGDKDRVYVLGDLAMKPNAVGIVARAKGRKVLIKGNHDIQKIGKYLPLFDDIRAFHKLDAIIEGVRRKFVLTHIPIHPHCMDRWDCNVHGHLHYRRVTRDRYPAELSDSENDFLKQEVDPRYLCVSVEHTNYRPIDFAEVQKLWIVQQ